MREHKTLAKGCKGWRQMEMLQMWACHHVGFSGHPKREYYEDGQFKTLCPGRKIYILIPVQAS
jgi:hypothetical protein